MNRLLKVLFIFSYLVTLCAAVKAQSANYISTHYSIDNYWKDNNVLQGAQDGYGFMWFRGSYSLARFDGNEFRYYRHENEDSLLQIGPDVIGGLIVDEEGSLWVNNLEHAAGAKNVSTRLLRYDLSKDGFISYQPKVKSFIRSLSIETTDTAVWLGSRTEGLYLFNMITHETWNYPNEESKRDFYMANNHIRSIQNHNKYLLLATNNGIWRFDKKTKQYSRDAKLPQQFRAGALDFNKNWVIRWDSLSVFKVDTALQILKTTSYPANDIDFDARDNVLFKSNTNGKVILSGNKNRIDTLISEPDSSSDCMFDREGNIWICGFSNGIYKFSPSNLPYKRIDVPIANESVHILEINGKRQSVFLGENSYIATSTWPIEKSTKKVFDFKGRDDARCNMNFPLQGKKYFWIATWPRGLVRIPIDFDKKSLSSKGAVFLEPAPDNPYMLGSPTPWTLYEDEKENIWVGHFDKGIDVINSNMPYGTEGSIDRLRSDPQNPETLSSDLIQSIIPDADGSILIGTGAGVDRYLNGKITRVWKTGYRTNLTKTDNGEIYASTFYELYKAVKNSGNLKFSRVEIGDVGVSGNLIYDLKNRLWINTAQGLLVYDPKLNLITRFFDDPEFRDLSIDLFKVSEHEFIYVKPKSLISFDPSSFQVDSSGVRSMLTSLKVNNKIVHRDSPDLPHIGIEEDISTASVLKLDYRHNNFELIFSALNYSSPEQNRYKHKLDGYDDDWIETDYKNRTATYTNLPAGTYTFRVRASNHHGVWSENERTLKVIILPPPWRTWWAYTGYLMLVAGLLVWARRNIVQRERLKSNLKLEHLELEKAKEVDKVKTSFFTNISHEFRTPLTLIKGPVQNMIDQFVDGQKEFDRQKIVDQLKLVQRNSDLLLKLINQLLDLAKLESGSLKVEKSEGDVYSFVRAIASSFESFARQKNVSIQVNVPDGNCPALFDKDKVETILINLINNAVKFTPGGGKVTVSANLLTSPPAPLQMERGASAFQRGVNVDNHHSSATPLSSGEGVRLPSAQAGVRLIIADTGIGIPPDQQSKIFERFHQVSEAHKEVGTGIGLALVKELVALMGGEISVASEVGKGSEFKVVLPLEIVSLRPSLPTEAVAQAGKTDANESQSYEKGFDKLSLTTTGRQSITEQDSNKPHILIVEDNTDLRHFIIDSLGTEFHFLEAENGKQGLEKATHEIPDLIISDVMMPEMDGITMAGKIKKDIRTSHIPLILLTAKSSEDSKLSGLSSGADDYLTKPFNKNELLLKVRNGVSRQLKLREKLRAELMSTAPKVEVLSEDEKFLNSVKEKILERLSDEQLSVESLAEDMGMSRVQLYRKVSGLTGISVNELIRKLRLQRAAQLLQQNWGPVSQVAYEVGFSNLSYFSKMFKEEFGVLPSEYELKI
mgnify:CR=1 FL=1